MPLLISRDLWVPAAVFYAATLLLVPRVLLNRASRPSGKVAWLLLILFLPAVGGVLYLILAAGRDETFAAAKREADADLSGLLPDRHEEDPPDAPPGLRRVWDLAGELAGHPAAGPNRVRVFADSAAGLRELVAALGRAERSASLLYYTVRNDDFGREVRDALCAAAGRGVAVRVLYDRFGSFGLRASFWDPLRVAGGRAEPFQPRGSGVADRLRLNLRNHRKLTVVDGGEAFTGGANLADDYLSRVPETAPWRDTVLHLRGPAAGRLMRVFAQDWAYATGERLTDPALYKGGGVGDGKGEAERGGGWIDGVTVRVVDDGPDRPDRAHESVLAAALHAAGDRADLSTGYFVPTDPVARALRCAARRGVRVRVLHGGPGSPRTTRLAARWGYRDLLEAGVEIHERAGGTVHAKTLAVDGHFALAGTPNCDARSLRLNFEVSVVTLDARVAETLHDQFAADLPTAPRVDPDAYHRRPTARRLAEAACDLFSPVL